MKPGEILRSPLPNNRFILNAATKDDYRYASKIEWIESILKTLRERIEDGTITSLAMPAIGCGLGGLNWDVVGPLIAQYLDDLDIEIDVYIASSMQQYHKKAE